MPKPIILGMIVFLTISLLVVGQQMPTGVTLRGRVIYTDTGLPVRRAWVGLDLIRKFPATRSGDLNANATSSEEPGYLNSATNSNASGYSDGFVLTGDNGEYVIKDVLPGEYYAVARQPGIRNPTLADINNPNFQKIVVTGTDEIKFDIYLRRGGAVEGTIRYQDGSRAPGAEVNLRRLDDGEYEEAKRVSTDDRGVYRFSGLAEGDYIVSAGEKVIHSGRDSSQITEFGSSSPGRIEVYFPGVYSFSDATPVAVRLAAETRSIDITIPDHSLFEVSGRVVAKHDGKPIAGANVVFKREGEENDWRLWDAQSSKTEADGTFLLGALLLGEYELSISGPSLSKVEDPGRERQFASVIKKIEITDGSLENIEVALPYASRISGRVVGGREGRNEDSMWVYVESEKDIPSNASSVQNEDNALTFSIDELPPGGYFLNLHSDSGYYVERVMVGGRDITREKISLAEGESIEGIEIYVADDFGTIKGSISNPRIPAGRYVYLVPVDSVGWPASKRYTGRAGQIEETGRFMIRAQPGEYWVVTRKLGRFDDSKTFEQRKEIYTEWVEGAETVEIKAGKTIEVTVRIDN